MADHLVGIKNNVVSKWVRVDGRVAALADKMNVSSFAVKALNAVDVMDMAVALKVAGHDELKVRHFF